MIRTRTMPMTRSSRKRVFAPRSRSGCHTCKGRHLRCDEHRPFCDNCLRLGRTCTYGEEEVPPARDGYQHRSRARTAEASGSHSRPEEVLVVRDFAIVLRSPSLHRSARINYVSPLYQNLAPSAAVFLHYYQNVVSFALLGPQYGHKVALTEHFPRVLQQSFTNDFVKHSLVHMAAVKYYLITKRVDENKLQERYEAAALIGLQEAIERCSAENVDAILAASIHMIEGAHDWQHWSIVLAGYSAILAMNLPSNLPEIWSPKFIFQRFPPAPFHSIHTLPHPSVRTQQHLKVASILRSLAAMRPLLLERRESHTESYEFRNIEILGESLRHVHRAETTQEVFVQFEQLKSWMFCIELKTSSSEDVYGEMGARAVRLHFYGLLEAMIPYFPPSCRARLTSICGTEIPLLKDELISERCDEMTNLIEQFWTER